MTGTTTHLILAMAVFLIIHIVPSSALRGRLVAILGQGGYLAFYSILSLAGIVWVVMAFNAASFSGYLWYLPYVMNYVAAVLILLGFILFIGGQTQPNPASVGQSVAVGDDPARGFMRITRHPFLVSVVLWGTAHILVRGDYNALIFFGGFLVLAAAGTLLIDAKRRKADPEGWARYSAVTSIIPFLAILQGRNRLVVRELGWWRLLLAVVVFIGFLHLHPIIMGVDPLP
ncbi:MAG: NnrU family protein [Minwuia sp.]|nr:NnrU family protein [Minwuia sp.]